MNTRHSIVLSVMLIALLASACAPAAAAGSNRFAGTWAGTMSFTDDANRKEDIQVMIPQDCKVGQACGYIDNLTVKCKWEMTLADLQGMVFAYKFSKTLSGECPALGGGTLTLQADGTLQREHKTPDFTASGPLTKQK
jgi:hypothetical protein